MDTILERFNSGSHLFFEKGECALGEDVFCISTDGEGNEMYFGDKQEALAYVKSLIGDIPTISNVVDLSERFSVNGIHVGKWKWKIRYMRVNPKGWQTVQI